jgi:hypothetical protein
MTANTDDERWDDRWCRERAVNSPLAQMTSGGQTAGTDDERWADRWHESGGDTAITSDERWAYR